QAETRSWSNIVTGDENELGAWPVRRLAHLVEVVARLGQRRGDFITLPETERGVRPDDGVVCIEGEDGPERDQVANDSCQLFPRLNHAHARDVRTAIAFIARPAQPRSPGWVSRLKDKPATRPQRSTQAAQGRGPIRVGEEDLRYVASHGRQIHLQ